MNSNAAGVLYEEWPSFARMLSISDLKIKSLQHQISINGCIIPDVLNELLTLWISQSEDSVSLDMLIAQLQKMNWNEFASKCFQILVICNVEGCSDGCLSFIYFFASGLTGKILAHKMRMYIEVFYFSQCRQIGNLLRLKSF